MRSLLPAHATIDASGVLCGGVVTAALTGVAVSTI